MIGVLLSIFFLWFLLAAGFYGASLGLRALDAGAPPKLGVTYRAYAAAANAYAARRDALASASVVRFPRTRLVVANRQLRVASRALSPEVGSLVDAA
jgi:hypothetical protein